MNYSCINFSLDIHSPVSQVSLAVKKGETNKKLRISLIENGKPFKLTKDCAVVFSGIKPDGTILYNECIIKNNVIEYIPTEQTTKIEGIVDCEILVYGGDSQVLYTASFSIVVYSPAYDIDDVLTSTNEYTALISAMSRLEKAIEEAEKGSVYIGSGDMPEGYNVQIDPDGEVIDIEEIVDRSVEKTVLVLESLGLVSLCRADENTVLTDKDDNIFMF